MCVCVCVSHSVVSDSLWPHGLYTRLLWPWNSPGKNTGVDCHSLLQEIFPTQGLNPGLLHHRKILYCLSYREVLFAPQGWGQLHVSVKHNIKTTSKHGQEHGTQSKKPNVSFPSRNTVAKTKVAGLSWNYAWEKRLKSCFLINLPL